MIKFGMFKTMLLLGVLKIMPKGEIVRHILVLILSLLSNVIKENKEAMSICA